MFIDLARRGLLIAYIISEFSDNADLLFYLKRSCDFGVITDNLDIMINCAFFGKCPNFIFFADLLPSTSGDFEYGYLVNNLPEYEKNDVHRRLDNK